MAQPGDLLALANVTFMKITGTLRFRPDSVVWNTPPGSDQQVVSIAHRDIRVQKISPDSKDKVQLQIVPHDESRPSLVFHFCNPSGKEARLQDRNSVRDLIVTAMRELDRETKELERKKHRLLEDDRLARLYVSLVSSGTLTVDEFWHEGRPGSCAHSGQGSEQEVAPFASLSEEIVVYSDKGTLHSFSASTKSGIFKVYPELERKFKEVVPSTMDENSFWQDFVGSAYFRMDDRSLLYSGMFARCLAADERRLTEGGGGEGGGGGGEEQRAESSRSEGRSVSLREEDIVVLQGEAPDCALLNEFGDWKSSLTPDGAHLFRRLNGHSGLVLAAVCRPPESPRAEESGRGQGGAGRETGEQRSPPNSVRGVKRKFGDVFGEEKDSAPSSSSNCAAVPLKLIRTEGYRQGPFPLEPPDDGRGDPVCHPSTAEEEDARKFFREVRAWTPTAVKKIFSDGDEAVEAMDELRGSSSSLSSSRTSGNRRHHHQHHHHHQDQHRDLNHDRHRSSDPDPEAVAPPEILREATVVYGAAAELLRRFWSCFPANSAEKEERAARMSASIRKFRDSTVVELSRKAASCEASYDPAKGVDAMLLRALEKYETWSAATRRGRR